MASSPTKPPTTTKLKTIGIIGGTTDLATTEYYKIINARIRSELGGLNTAEVIINSMNCGWSTYYVQNELWSDGAAYLRTKAQSLERAGADFILCVSNTWHRMCGGPEGWMQGVGVPLLHIADPTAEEVKRAGISRVGLLGTKATMESEYLRGYFLERHGIEVVVPDVEEREFVGSVIFEELAKGVFREDSRRRYLEIIDGLEKKGAQGVVLGCTEIMLLDIKSRPGMPIFDTLTLHAEAAAMKSLGR